MGMLCGCSDPKIDDIHKMLIWNMKSESRASRITAGTETSSCSSLCAHRSKVHFLIRLLVAGYGSRNKIDVRACFFITWTNKTKKQGARSVWQVRAIDSTRLLIDIGTDSHGHLPLECTIHSLISAWNTPIKIHKSLSYCNKGKVFPRLKSVGYMLPCYVGLWNIGWWW
jgi:hypothetical protein